MNNNSFDNCYTMLTELEPTYFLHTRAYRDTSLLIEAFTRQYGKVSVVARGVKGKKNRNASLLQPFAPLLISWWARGELGTLRHTELHQQPHWLTGNRLVSGLYLNELLNRLLGRHEAYPFLFDFYALTVQRIATFPETELSTTLRLFEKFLLAQLGYGLTFDKDAQNGNDVELDNYYAFDPARGCYQMQVDNPDYVARHLFKGSSLLALHHEQFSDKEQVNDAKRLMRMVLAQHLGEKPLYSRGLYL